MTKRMFLGKVLLAGKEDVTFPDGQWQFSQEYGVGVQVVTFG